MGARDRLAARGLSLPPAPAPAAAYLPARAGAGLVFTAGQLPVVDGALPQAGLVGVDVTLEEAREHAATAALNVLAVAAEAADGDLDRVRVVRLGVYVASATDFTDQHLVANGASDLVADVLGPDRGVHARSAVGVACLPLNAPVEVEAILEIDPA